MASRPLALLLLCLAGCGAQQALLGSQGKYVVTTYDVIVAPGQEAMLRVRLRSGDLLGDMPGYVARYYLDGRLYKTAETDDEGFASAAFTPSAENDYRFTVEFASVGFPEAAPAAQPLLVRCRSADAPLAVVDLDNTLVASPVEAILLGQAKPMPHSQEAMRDLAQTHAIIYLTYRPDVLGQRTRQWLWDHQYPPGPLLLANSREFLSGSEKYKRSLLKGLRRTFQRIDLGIGDQVSDARAYQENQVRPILLLKVDEGADAKELMILAEEVGMLSPRAAVVKDWTEAQAELEGRAEYPPSRMQQRIWELARQKARQAAEAKAK